MADQQAAEAVHGQLADLVQEVTPSSEGYTAATTYINEAGTKEERRQRKAEVFRVIYGNNSARSSFTRQLDNYDVQGATTGRMHITHPTLKEARRDPR